MEVKALGKKLCELRKACGMRQDAVAEALRVSRQNIVALRMERMTPHWSNSIVWRCCFRQQSASL